MRLTKPSHITPERIILSRQGASDCAAECVHVVRILCASSFSSSSLSSRGVCNVIPRSSFGDLRMRASRDPHVSDVTSSSVPRSCACMSEMEYPSEGVRMLHSVGLCGRSCDAVAYDSSSHIENALRGVLQWPDEPLSLRLQVLHCCHCGAATVCWAGVGCRTCVCSFVGRSG